MNVLSHTLTRIRRPQALTLSTVSSQLLIQLQSAEFSMSRSRKWRTKDIASRLHARAEARMEKEVKAMDYSGWSNEDLIKRVTDLELELKKNNASMHPPASPKPYKKQRREKPFDSSKYSTRLVAFKLAYLGKKYNGFEHHLNNKTPLPTIEEELWKALRKAHLISPTLPDGKKTLPDGDISWEGTEYSKCGRTDKGVSAFGQVIGIKVRSNRPLPKNKESSEGQEGGEEGTEVASKMDIDAAEATEPPFDTIKDELPYCQLLNRLLPPEIRILAWCPTPPADFSARFSCRERQYKYFFTQPAFAPIPSPPTPLSSTSKSSSAAPKPHKDGWLDIEAMREAAHMYVGLHDFRNFCKVDASKQISNFDRRIFHAEIEEVSARTSAPSYVTGAAFLPNNIDIASSHADADAVAAFGAVPDTGAPKVYTFTLHGSAFLWHQVRCMVAILFLVGQGLEKPSVVADLLDVQKTPRRPLYEMAQDTPLVLWDCIFPEALDWEWVSAENKYGVGGLMDDLWRVWRADKIEEVLAGSLINMVSQQGGEVDRELVLPKGRKGGRSQKAFDGGDGFRLQGEYVQVMRKPVMESPAEINDKFAQKKGYSGAAEMKEAGVKRLRFGEVAEAEDDANE